MILLESLIFSWILLESTVAVKDYIIHPLPQDWVTAQRLININGRSMLPDIGLDGFKGTKIFEDLEVDELVWLNAKDAQIDYGATGTIHVKLAYITADSKLTAYLCHNANIAGTKKYVNMSPLSWAQANSKCKSTRWTLYSISTAGKLKGAVSLLRNDVPFWVANMSTIPDVVSETSKTKEMCLGVMKMADGTLTYRRDNCTEKHRFVSIPSIENFALAVTKMSRPYPLFSGEIEPDIEAETIGISTIQQNSAGTIVGINHKDETHEDESLKKGIIGGIVGVVLGGVVVIILFSVAVYFLRRRLRSRRDYLRSLQRYTHRHASSRQMLSHTMPTGNTLTLGNDSTQNNSLPSSFGKSSSCMSKQNDNNMMQAQYEECEKRKYADCQNDVVQDLKSRYAKYPGPLSSSSGLEILPAYHSMNGNHALQVLPAYERYDPDPGHLQQIHGSVNKENDDQLPQQEQYDNIPKLPKKSGKRPTINDLETYENNSTGNKSMMGKTEAGKHLRDPEQTRSCSLDELKQYENYKVPKREKGLFKMFRSERAKQAKKENIGRRDDPISLNDLQEYESVETPSAAKKEIKALSDLDTYENLDVKI